MSGFEALLGVVPVLVIVIFIVGSSVRILREYERGVIFRFGRRATAVLNPGGDGSGPGLVLLIPFVDKMVKVSLRTITMDVPPQDVITRDNVSVKVNAVVFFRVLDANKAVISVEDYLYATSQMAQTTLRSVLGQQELDDLLSARDKINQQLDQTHTAMGEYFAFTQLGSGLDQTTKTFITSIMQNLFGFSPLIPVYENGKKTELAAYITSEGTVRTDAYFNTITGMAVTLQGKPYTEKTIRLLVSF